jgi:L-idonate 5-dehydrogenase
VVLFGAGAIGLLTMLDAKLKACGHTTMVDLAAAPLSFAERLGADRIINVSAGDDKLKAFAKRTTFDVGFEVTGSAAGLASAIASVRHGGTLVQIGNLPAGEISVPANAIMAKEPDFKGRSGSAQSSMRLSA